MRLSIVQFESKHLDPPVNLERIDTLVAEEARKGADLIVFPELATTGYLEPVTPDDAYDPGVTGDATREDFLMRFAALAEEIPGPVTEKLAATAALHDVYIVVGLLEKLPAAPGMLANSIVIVGPDGLVGKQRKLHMPWNEKHTFVQGDHVEVFDVGPLKIGLNVCYDAYFPEQSRMLALQGAHLIISCFTGPTRSLSDKRVLNDRASFIARTRALENSVYFVALNRTGSQGDYRFIGNSAIAGPQGELLAHTTSAEECSLTTDIDASEVVRARIGLSPVRDRRPELYGAISSGWVEG